MLSFYQILLAIMGGFVSLGILVGGCGYAYGQWKEGKDKRAINAITLLEKDVETLKNEVEKLTTEVHKLRQENELERKKFTEAILAMQALHGGSGPLSKFIEQGNHYMTYTMPVMDRINKFLDKQIL